MTRRAVGWWGVAFTVLLLVSAGMATVPGGDNTVTEVRQFYADHAGVVLVAQLIGLAAAAAFIPFALGVQRQLACSTSGRPGVAAFGVCVSAAAALAAVPPLLLCWMADSSSGNSVSALAQASDWVDVVLYVAIAGFAVAVFLSTSSSVMRVVAAVVAVVCVVRAVLLLAGSSALELVAPLTFLGLVVGLSVMALRRTTATQVS